MKAKATPVPVEKFSDVTTNKDRVAFIKGKLQDDNRWLFRGLLAIYDRQTSVEQSSLTTREHNNVGFSAFDAEFLSAMAQRVKAGYTLTARQIEATRKAMMKYAGQLSRIAQGAA